MRSYLIQRGTFKDKVDISSITGIDDVIQFDYMGSSEFEWGSLPKSLKRIISSARESRQIFHTITIKDKEFYLYAPMFDVQNLRLSDVGFESTSTMVEYVTKLFNEKAVEPYGGTRLKEVLSIDTYFEGKTVKRLKHGCVSKMETTYNHGYCDFWWDIDNDYMVFPVDKDMKKKFDIAIQKLIDKGFGKE